MESNKLFKKNILELRGLLDRKDISSVELTRAYLDRIQDKNKSLNAFLTVSDELALKQAQNADAMLSKNGSNKTMSGIPVALKDNILLENYKATAGSQFLKDFVAPFDATVTQKLKEAGAVILGKTNCDEFAMGSSNENSSFGPVKNPWNLTKVPGGSSGGSAATAAAKLATVALGTDTGGSIRQPAAFCGVVGLKPTYGCVSRYGVVAFASSLDQVGPIAPCVEDAAVAFETIYGQDPRESTSEKSPTSFEGIAKDLKNHTSLKGVKVGYPSDFLPAEMHAESRDHFLATLKTLEKLGADVREVSLPHAQYGVACYYVLAPAEASTNLSRFDGIRYTTRSKTRATLKEVYTHSRTEGFGAEVRRRIILGTFVLSSGYYDTYYLKAQNVRRLIQQDFQKAFADVDVIVTPTAPSAAFDLNSKTMSPVEMYLADIFTVPVSIAGLPAVSVPSGLDKSGLPLGIQIIGKHWAEKQILETAYVLEQNCRIFERIPV